MPSKDPRKYYAENRDRINALKRRWRAANPSRIREANRRTYVRTRERRQENLNRLRKMKVEQGCADCGYRAHPVALEFDHIGGDKVADVSSMLSGPWSLIEVEVAKCEVVCANCHAVRTEARGWSAGRPPVNDVAKPGQPMLW